MCLQCKMMKKYQGLKIIFNSRMSHSPIVYLTYDQWTELRTSSYENISFYFGDKKVSNNTLTGQNASALLLFINKDKQSLLVNKKNHQISKKNVLTSKGR